MGSFRGFIFARVDKRPKEWVSELLVKALGFFFFLTKELLFFFFLLLIPGCKPTLVVHVSDYLALRVGIL